MRNDCGFTLVELIVVIAVLAILAGVTVPAYSGYIARAQDAAVLVELEEVVTAAQAAAAVMGVPLRKIIVEADGTVTAFTDDGADPDTNADPLDITAFYDTDGRIVAGIGKHSAFRDHGCVWESGGEQAGIWTALE